jgi:lysophospholipase L1-like esterase
VHDGPWHVRLKIEGCRQDAIYNWSVDGRRIEPERTGQCGFSYAFPTQRLYDVRVRATIGGQRFEGDKHLTIKDWLIVVLGDSVASGEGVPEIPSHLRSGRLRAKWQNKRCHRSADAAPALAAEKIAKANPRESVTFVSLACSGARIRSGLLDRYPGLTHPVFSAWLPAQVEQLNAISRRRKPAAVIISVGANDVGFSNIIIRCGRTPFERSCLRGGLESAVTHNLDELPRLYDRLSRAISHQVSPEDIYLMQYFDPTGSNDGEVCPGIFQHGPDGLGFFGLSAVDLQDAREKILEPLNDMVANAVALHHWREITGIAKAFREHGYCTKHERWITTLGDSFSRQSGQGLKGWLAGAFHPNYEGHERIASRIEMELEQSLTRPCASDVSTTPRNDVSAVARIEVNAAYRIQASSPTPRVADQRAIADAGPAACTPPGAVDGALLPGPILSGMNPRLWILIVLAAVASIVLVLTVASSTPRVREAAPVILAAVIGAGLLDLGVQLQNRTAQAVVLTVAGVVALLAVPALLWWLRASGSRDSPQRTVQAASPPQQAIEPPIEGGHDPASGRPPS